MIKSSVVTLESLPRVDFSPYFKGLGTKRDLVRLLPDSPAIYFFVAPVGIVYVGECDSLADRIGRTHDKWVQFGEYISAVVYWLACDGISRYDRRSLERNLIRLNAPKLNRVSTASFERTNIGRWFEPAALVTLRKIEAVLSIDLGVRFDG